MSFQNDIDPLHKIFVKYNIHDQRISNELKKNKITLKEFKKFAEIDIRNIAKELGFSSIVTARLVVAWKDLNGIKDDVKSPKFQNQRKIPLKNSKSDAPLHKSSKNISSKFNSTGGIYNTGSIVKQLNVNTSRESNGNHLKTSFTSPITQTTDCTFNTTQAVSGKNIDFKINNKKKKHKKKNN